MGEKCWECKEFFGAPEREGLCSSCFKAKFPEAAKATEQKKANRNKPVELWEASWTAATKNANEQEIARLLQEWDVAQKLVEDLDDALCKRHCDRMQSLIHNAIYEAFSEPFVSLKAMIKAGATEFTPTDWWWNVVLGPFPKGDVPVDVMDILLEDERLASALNNDHLGRAIIKRPLRVWVDKILVPRFTDSDQLFITEIRVNTAKLWLDPEFGGPTKESKEGICSKEAEEFVRWIEELYKARCERLGIEVASEGGRASRKKQRKRK